MAVDLARAVAFAQTLGVACAGALLFWLIGFPAAPLTGAAAAGSVAALAGMQVHIPDRFKTLCFLVLGVSIGATVTPEVIQGAARWPISLAVLSGVVVVSLFACRLLLMRVFDADPLTATLASAPGHLSFVIAIAADSRSNVQMVALVQSIRLLVLTLLVPPILVFFLGAAGTALPVTGSLSIAALAGLLVLSFLGGLRLLRFQVPAPYLMAGMVFGAAGQLTGWAAGAPPAPVLVLSLIAMGGLIASRFGGVDLAMLRRYALAGLAVTGILLIVALAGAFVMALTLGYKIDLLIAGYAPGGIETMAAIAVQTGLDSTFVAAHHVVRLLVLTLLVPVVMNWRRTGPNA